MKTLRKFGMFAALLSLATIFAMPDLAAQTKRKPVVKKAAVRKKVTPLYTVSSGKRFYAKMNDTISSKTARVGDRFTARITEPVYANNGSLVIPQGSEVVGRVNSVKAAAKGGKPGTIDVSFVQVVLPNGKKRAINGSLTDLDSKSAKSDSEGTASGDKMKNRKLIFIGGGGAGGAILGAAIGGGKGALIGGLLGAGGGFLGERYTKGENAEVKSGTEFGIYLNQAISMPKFVEINP
ncbi:MAG: TrbI/VirB10 family protein [Saprospiraceae bacterium]|nr:TrbI/VirB10 family protein [Pyrinomonadaceae bacterium]